MATKIKLMLGGMFGKSGRYYEFSQPLELVAETEEGGSWIHRIEELEIWCVEPERDDSFLALMDLLDAEYEMYGNPKQKFRHPAATRNHERFQKAIKHVY